MKSNNTERDLALLQGTWQQVAEEVDGVTGVRSEASAADTLTIFAGNEFAMAAADGKVLLKGTVRLDATTIPRQAVWVESADKGKAMPAIYSVSENSLVFAAANDDRAATPTDFRTEIGQILRRFVRKHG